MPVPDYLDPNGLLMQAAFRVIPVFLFSLFCFIGIFHAVEFYYPALVIKGLSTIESAVVWGVAAFMTWVLCGIVTDQRFL